MDDYLVGTAVLLLIGLITLFISSILANHHRESPELAKIEPSSPKGMYKNSSRVSKLTAANKEDSQIISSQTEPEDTSGYERLILRYQDKVNPFSQLEATAYILGISILGFGSSLLLWEYIALLALLLVTLMFMRSVIYGLGSRFANKLFTKVYPIISVLAATTLPVSAVLAKIRSAIGGNGLTEDSREEIETLVDSAKEEGSLEDSEYRLLKNIMGFSEVLVSDVMTPRTVVFSLPEETTVGESIKIKEIKNYSRIPVYSGLSLDEGVKGYVTARDILAAYAEGETDKQLSTFSRKIHFIPDNLELSRALEQFLLTQQHMYIVVDEYGGVDGLITMEDVLETILGVEIVDEADTITDLRKLAKKTRDYRQKRKKQS